MAESLLILVTLVLMLLSLLLIVIPVIPVTALEWGIAMLFGVLTGFSRFTPAAALLTTAFMLLGVSANYWMPLLGMKGNEVSCMGLVAFFVGMFVGQALVPIPFVGMMLGGVIAVIAVEFLREGDWRRAITGGGVALRAILYGMAAEFLFALAIVLTTIVAILTTASA